MGQRPSASSVTSVTSSVTLCSSAAPAQPATCLPPGTLAPETCLDSEDHSSDHRAGPWRECDQKAAHPNQDPSAHQAPQPSAPSGRKSKSPLGQPDPAMPLQCYPGWAGVSNPKRGPPATARALEGMGALNSTERLNPRAAAWCTEGLGVQSCPETQHLLLAAPCHVS